VGLPVNCWIVGIPEVILSKGCFGLGPGITCGLSVNTGVGKSSWIVRSILAKSKN
jgi:hypothetical protein